MNLLLFPVLVLTGGCFALGDRMGARVSSVRGQLILLLAGLLAAVPGMRFFLDDWNPCLYALWWCEVRSWPYIELTAAGVGFLAGMLCGGLPPRPRRWCRPCLLAAALVLAGLPLVEYDRTPANLANLADSWSDGVCRQTSGYTCGPACIATLLRHQGLPAGERELAQICRTTGNGTMIWDIARGLRRQGLRVSFRYWPELPPSLPLALASAQQGGSSHLIVLFETTPDRVVVGDPLKGRLTCTRAEMHRAYNLDRVYLVLE